MPRSLFVTSDEKLRVVQQFSTSFYRRTVERCAAKGRSLMIRRKMMGSSMLLCGAPAVTVLGKK